MSLSIAATSVPSFNPLTKATTLVRRRIPQTHVDTLIVGGGPAGLAPLIAASRDGTLDPILARGVMVVEQGAAIGAGKIGTYAANSDSGALTLLSCIFENPDPRFASLRQHPAVQAVAAYGNGAVPLKLVGAMMAAVGNVLHKLLITSPGCAVRLEHAALHTRQRRDGLWCTQIRRLADGAVRNVVSRLLVLATGGHQPDAELEHVHVAGIHLRSKYGGKLVQSNEALTPAGLADIGRRFAASGAKHVAILGSSSSAVACANALLYPRHAGSASADQVTLLHRRPLRVFYPSAETALADGYTEFGPDDICPLSGFVFRFAGFRLESREIVMAARGIGGRLPDPRLKLHHLNVDPDAAAQRSLESASVIIVALGYRPLGLPVLSVWGRPVPLLAHGAGKPAFVDDACRVLDRAGRPIPGLLGIGLASGFIAPATCGGEPSFSGQSNGIWQWQNVVGEIVAREMRAPGAMDWALAAAE